jgi:hypothetical protein
MNGSKVCKAHGGRARQVKAKAAQVLAERKAEAILVGLADYEPVTDPLTTLQHLAGRAVRLLDVLEGVVSELTRLRYSTQAEQIDGRVIVYERAMDRAGRLVADLARLNIDERLAKVSGQQAEALNRVLRGALADLGVAVTDEAVRAAVARQLRLVAGGPVPRGALTAPAGTA